MALPEALEHGYIIGNIFLNSLAFLKVWHQRVRFLMVHSYEGKQYNN